MNNGAIYRQLRELLKDSQSLLTAINNFDNDEISRLLEKRQQSIDAIQKAGGVSPELREELSFVSDEIIKVDGEVISALSQYMKSSGKTADNFKKKAVGIKGYNYDILSTSSSRFFDTKR